MKNNKLSNIDNDYIKEITIEEFRHTGMLLYINQILQPFGLSLTIVDDEKIVPIKSKFRGFDEKSVENAYSNINNYLKNNIKEITNIFLA